ncbi:PREDICTED: protein FAM45A-like [Ceratosolen solmsi marchali]|uniref:Protein FAM45A-like n=1 Tax=Ceratosolen solmsi marchali TaxID=326594 RepID=A0AAJ7DYR1_9HYME|nr:PREDICTED: protein FAM45A-like [Ceratosolen solmsi marchali]
MAPLTELVLCSILERDSNGDTLWTWNYPTMIESEKSFITRKYNSQLEHNNIQSFVFSRHGQYWFYIYNNEADSEKLPKVKQFAIVLLTTDYCPQKYELLCKIFSKTYNQSGDPVEILKLYLSAYTKGSCITKDNESFSSNDFDALPFGLNTNLKELIKVFELETILIYTALLLKKRIVVYHHSLEQLLKWIRTFPVLMKHRKIADNLLTWVDLIPDELNELKKNSFYVAGCRDNLISSKPELYDLLVNIPAREVIVPNHAKESFTMTKTHKEIALFMVQLCENQSLTEVQIISEIADKTQDLLNQLITLATVETPEGAKKVPIQSIKEKNLATAVENFLINLAIAENLLIM